MKLLILNAGWYAISMAGWLHKKGATDVDAASYGLGWACIASPVEKIGKHDAPKCV